MPRRPVPKKTLSRRGFGLGVTVGLAGVGVVALGGRLFSTSESPAPESPAPAKPSGSRLPTVFVAHGSPTLALDAAKGADFRRWGRELASASAVLVISAHWEAAPITLGSSVARDLIYDFYGFPRELYQVRYPCPGAPELGKRVEVLLAGSGQPFRRDESRGLDHGAWVPLVHLFPNADVPVMQISMPSSLGARALFDLGRALAPLRDEGVLLVGSGNLTHNLRRVDWSPGAVTPAWASEFDSWIADVLTRRDFDALVDYAHHAPALHEAHPTEEHLQPVLVAAGAASGSGGGASFPVQGFEYGSISRRSVQLA
jgi:4,5-DOPA dioxygenase extradiol